MEQEKNISPEESLNLIQKVIQSSQNKYSENGVIIMLASGLFALASVIDFVLGEMKMDIETRIVYCITFLFLFFLRKGVFEKIKHKKFLSFADEYFDGYIIAFQLTAVMIGSLCLNYKIPSTAFELILASNFCFVCMIFFEQKLFGFGAAMMIIVATCVKYFDVKFYPLVMAAALLIGIFVPALLMYLKSKKESV